MSEQEPHERPTRPARVGHKFQQPIVEERPQRPRQAACEHNEAAEGDISEAGDGADGQPSR